MESVNSNIEESDMQPAFGQSSVTSNVTLIGSVSANAVPCVLLLFEYPDDRFLGVRNVFCHSNSPTSNNDLDNLPDLNNILVKKNDGILSWCLQIYSYPRENEIICQRRVYQHCSIQLMYI